MQAQLGALVSSQNGLGRRTKYYLGLLTVTHLPKAQLCLLVSSQIQFGTESKASVVWCATFIPNTVWDEEQNTISVY